MSGREHPSAHVTRAGEDMYRWLADVAERTATPTADSPFGHLGISMSIRLSPRGGYAYRSVVDLWAAVEKDIFGESVECLFRRRLMDLLERKDVKWREPDMLFSARPMYRLWHVKTGTPIVVRVARSPEQWNALQAAEANRIK